MKLSDFLTEDSRVSTTLGTTMSRRSLMKGLAGAGAAALAVGTIGRASAEHTVQAYTVSANANFRSGPGTNYSLLGVVIKGATFKINGQVQNGYAGIIYNGTNGWVLASLVVHAGTPPSTPPISGQSVTTATANLRSGPGTSYPILKVVPAGSVIGHSETLQNGFRYVNSAGTGGWMYNIYTGYGGTGAGPEEGTFTTTANVNFRTQPSTSAPIIQVLPTGTKVQPLPTVPVNDFFNVTYNGKTGWVASAYLQT